MIYKNSSFTIFQKYDDTLLVKLANKGNSLAEDYLIKRYKKLVKIKANAYYLIGADAEDVIQEGMIGLIKAVRNYSNLKLTSFKVFAEICIIRQIITAIKKASRKKRLSSKYCISFNQLLEGNTKKHNPVTLNGIYCLKANDPMNIFLSKERLQELRTKSNEILSNLEIKVLKAYLDGKTYKDIAFEINRNVKCVDNAIQRIKKKFEFIDKLN